MYHIETHSGIRTLRPASGLQTYPLAIGNGVRFNMVGSQGVEPRCPLGRLIYSQVQSPVLLATHVTKTLATRTGFEPVSSAVTGRRNRPDYANEPIFGGDGVSRTHSARGGGFTVHWGYQLSYISKIGRATGNRTPLLRMKT